MTAMSQTESAEVGLVDVSVSELLSMATHSAAETDETPLIGTPPVMFFTVHVGCAASGFVEISALPSASPAMQSALDGHEIAVSGFEAILLVAHVGAESVEVSAFPASSTATQNAAERHVTAVSELRPSIGVIVQAGFAAVGLLVATARPVPFSTPTHRLLATQETATIGLFVSGSVAVHAGVAAAGAVETRMLP